MGYVTQRLVKLCKNHLHTLICEIFNFIMHSITNLSEPQLIHLTLISWIILKYISH